MTRSRGYHSYRGRTPKWKAVLAVVLVLVILGAVGFMMLQEHIVYDGTGTPHLRLPQQETEDTGNAPEEEESVEVVIQEPEGPREVHAFSLPVQTLTQQTVDTALAAPQAECNAVAVTLKDDQGHIYFDAAEAVSGTVRTEADTTAALASLTGQEDLYTVARISCFHDPKAANAEVESMGLKNTGGYVFYDGNNSQWLDPAKPEARQYLTGIIREAVALGFDEILLTDVSYPTEGKLEKIAYGDVDRQAQLGTFLAEVRLALEGYDVTLSVEVPETAILNGAEEASGVSLAQFAPHVDRFYAVTAPDRTDALSALTAAAEGTPDFAAELSAYDPQVKGSWLLTAS